MTRRSDQSTRTEKWAEIPTNTKWSFVDSVGIRFKPVLNWSDKASWSFLRKFSRTTESIPLRWWTVWHWNHRIRAATVLASITIKTNADCAWEFLRPLKEVKNAFLAALTFASGSFYRPDFTWTTLCNALQRWSNSMYQYPTASSHWKPCQKLRAKIANRGVSISKFRYS